MTVLKSYDLNGQKLSFANWISNLSPQDTPFTSMTKKESIDQTTFQWQTDALEKAGDNAKQEGGKSTEGSMRTTSIKANITQILRKTVKVSDTANALANYGRGQELQYQMEKSGKELKRDIEWALLHNVGSVKETAVTGRETAGFRGLVAGPKAKCPETGAVVHANTKFYDSTAATVLTEAALFGMTYNLYVAGSMASVIMFHPKHSSFFSALQEKGDGSRVRIFKDTPKFSVNVSLLIDPLGQEYKLLPNRWMPEDAVYFFCPEAWTQMILRAPQRTKLAKSGSFEKWMVEAELGLRHKHPYASGVLDLSTTEDAPHDGFNAVNVLLGESAGAGEAITANLQNVFVGSHVGFVETTHLAKGDIISIMKDGMEIHGHTMKVAGAANTTIYSKTATVADAGIYMVKVTKADGSFKISKGLSLAVTTDSGTVDPVSEVKEPVIKEDLVSVEKEVIVTEPVIVEEVVLTKCEEAVEQPVAKKTRKPRAKKAQ